MHKSYYAIIPADVRYDKDLTPNAKLLYGEITALCNEKGYCWAGDKYFCDLYKVNRTTIQRWFKQLEDGGYINREVQYRAGTREIEHRYTYLCDKGIRKNETTPTRKNETDNNTSLNTTFNNTNNKDIVGQPDNTPFKEVVDYLNEKTGKQYRSTTKATQTVIKARFKEGFTLDDFKKVIDTKTADWLKDSKMSEYLRPKTLFGADKFEGYLNQKSKVKPEPADDRYDLKHLVGREINERNTGDAAAAFDENEYDNFI